MKQAQKAQRLWVGLVKWRIYFYRDLDYKVLKADLFKTKRAALKCYEGVVELRVSQ